MEAVAPVEPEEAEEAAETVEAAEAADKALRLRRLLRQVEAAEAAEAEETAEPAAPAEAWRLGAEGLWRWGGCSSDAEAPVEALRRLGSACTCGGCGYGGEEGEETVDWRRGG